MDRLTQLQECLDKLSEMIFTSVGVLQRDAALLPTSPDIPVTAWTKEQVDGNVASNTELAKTVAKDMVQTAKVIDFLIDSLPGINQTEEDQLNRLKELQKENDVAGQELEETIIEAEKWNELLVEGLRHIADDQLRLHAEGLPIIKEADHHAVPLSTP